MQIYIYILPNVYVLGYFPCFDYHECYLMTDQHLKDLQDIIFFWPFSESDNTIKRSSNIIIIDQNLNTRKQYKQN